MKKIENVKKILDDNKIKYYDVGYSESGKFIDILYKDLELTREEAKENNRKAAKNMKMIFKKDIKNNNEIVAFMPYEFWNGQGDFTCYAHVGQHGACCLDYYKQCRNATKEEYQNLLNELKFIGYDVKIITRINTKEFKKAYKDFMAKNRIYKAV